MTIIQKRLAEVFPTLPYSEQNILLVLAVNYAPIGQMNLANLLCLPFVMLVRVRQFLYLILL